MDSEFARDPVADLAPGLGGLPRLLCGLLLRWLLKSYLLHGRFLLRFGDATAPSPRQRGSEWGLLFARPSGTSWGPRFLKHANWVAGRQPRLCFSVTSGPTKGSLDELSSTAAGLAPDPNLAGTNSWNPTALVL